MEESSQANPTWTYSDFGAYIAQLIADPGQACADTLQQEVLVLPQDPLVMAFGAIEPLACSLETTVDFYFYGAGADDVTWDFGTAGQGSGDTLTYDFGESGVYPVTLTLKTTPAAPCKRRTLRCSCPNSSLRWNWSSPMS